MCVSDLTAEPKVVLVGLGTGWQRGVHDVVGVRPVSERSFLAYRNDEIVSIGNSNSNKSLINLLVLDIIAKSLL